MPFDIETATRVQRQREMTHPDSYSSAQTQGAEAARRQEIARAPGGIARGMVAGFAGTPVDIANMALGVVGLGSESPVLGSKWIGEKLGGAKSLAFDIGTALPFSPSGAAKGSALALAGIAGKIGDASRVSHPVAKQIEELIAEHGKKYSAYGVRVIPHGDDVALGDVLGKSYMWKDGYITERMLKGTSTAGINRNISAETALGNLGVLGKTGPSGYYHGDTVVLVGGQAKHKGSDVGESVIPDPKVLAIWKKPTPGLSEVSADTYQRASDIMQDGQPVNPIKLAE